jgi:hypothetical protein
VKLPVNVAELEAAMQLSRRVAAKIMRARLDGTALDLAADEVLLLSSAMILVDAADRRALQEDEIVRETAKK